MTRPHERRRDEHERLDRDDERERDDDDDRHADAHVAREHRAPVDEATGRTGPAPAPEQSPELMERPGDRPHRLRGDRRRPGNTRRSPSSASMRSSRLYLATRSERDGAPVLIWPAPVATARSAMVVSSVSPERWLMTAPQPWPRARSTASSVSVSVPIWLSLMRIALAARSVEAALRARSRVGHEQVVTDQLARSADALGEQLPALPVVLGQAVLERHDRVARDPVGPEVDHLAGLEAAALLGQPVGQLAVGVRLTDRPAR